MKKFTLFVVFSFWLLIECTHAQTFTNYSTASTSKALCNSTVNSIAVDAREINGLLLPMVFQNLMVRNWTTYTVYKWSCR